MALLAELELSFIIRRPRLLLAPEFSLCCLRCFLVLGKTSLAAGAVAAGAIANEVAERSWRTPTPHMPLSSPPPCSPNSHNFLCKIGDGENVVTELTRQHLDRTTTPRASES